MSKIRNEDDYAAALVAEHGFEPPTVEVIERRDVSHVAGAAVGERWTIRCPYCECRHTHGAGEGLRSPHCTGGFRLPDYSLVAPDRGDVRG